MNFKDENGKEILEETVNLLFAYEDYLKSRVYKNEESFNTLEKIKENYKKIYVEPRTN